jgi:phospholipid/cholesterol/gamma-HCH transport system substrate-binding protein
MAEITIRISDKALRIVGLFLAAGVLVWVFSYLWASGTFTPKYQLLVYVPEVSGLRVGAKVRLDGPTVGSVAAIKLADGSESPERRIQLVLRISKRYQDAIRSDSVATVTSDAFLGNHYVAIHRGFEGTVINANGEIPFAPTREWTFKEFGKIVDCLKAEIKSTDSKTQVAPGTPSKSQR